jgi:adenosine deaminase
MIDRRGFSRAAGLAVLALGLVGASPPPASREAATARYFESLRKEPAQMHLFLREMPKGGDLHNHLSGAIYAESYLQWSANDGGCLVTATMTLVAGPCDSADGRIATSAVLTDETLYSRAINAMSMRHWDPSLNGHDHFFATFAKFGPASGKSGEMLAEVTARAASEHVSYLELMVTLAGATTARMGRELAWNGDNPDFGAARQTLLAAGFRAAVAAEARQRLDDAGARQRLLLHCDTAQAEPGCGVTVRYLTQVGRTNAPASVFTQILAGFELASQDPRLVGLNLVQPEDNPVAIRDFSLHMRMIQFLQPLYPGVRLTLHAGELTAGLVPPESLRFHIRDSVRIAGAKRIGHGVDLIFEDDVTALLEEMAVKKVLVEIALTSTDRILGVTGGVHPMHTYLKFGVPVALATDDAGVSRSTLTQEFQKAVDEQGLDYATLKRMVRNSIEYSFAEAPTKARLQLDVEKALDEFELHHRS